MLKALANDGRTQAIGGRLHGGFLLGILVSRVGIEPTTRRLRVVSTARNPEKIEQFHPRALQTLTSGGSLA